jgi:hypothetical protein
MVALLLVLLAGARASAAEPVMQAEAKAQYDEAMALYAAHDYRAAIAHLQTAYALDPRREILFAEAQATRLAGDCAGALPLYRRFLATSPPPQQVEATRIAVARCEAAALAPAPPPAVIAAPPPPPPPPRWYQDRAGGLLAGAGVVGLGIGAALVASAHTADDDARAVTSRYDAYETQRNKAERRWLAGVGALVAGSGLLVAGAGRYLWVGLHPRGGAVVGTGSRF